MIQQTRNSVSDTLRQALDPRENTAGHLAIRKLYY